MKKNEIRPKQYTHIDYEALLIYVMKNNVSLEENDISNYIKYDDNYFENISFDILIRNLKKEEKLILTLYYYSEYSTKEIAKILKINESTIRSKIARAKDKLINQYEGGYYE